jgi:hypothetical protein
MAGISDRSCDAPSALYEHGGDGRGCPVEQGSADAREDSVVEVRETLSQLKYVELRDDFSYFMEGSSRCMAAM